MITKVCVPVTFLYRAATLIAQVRGDGGSHEVTCTEQLVWEEKMTFAPADVKCPAP